MPAKWEGFSTNPDANTSSPPQGAPENMAAGEYNAVDRYVMAAMRELGDEMRTGNAPGATGGIGLTSLKNMAQQAKEQVTITGGRIGAPAGTAPPDGTLLIDASKLALGSGAGDAAKVPQAVIPKVNNAVLADGIASSPGGNTGFSLQAIYDMMHPVGALLFLDSGDNTVSPAPVVPNGVSATWTAISGGRFLRFKNTSGNIARTGENPGSTSAAGTHAHGGKTGSTVLTLTQIPGHTHAQRGGSAAGSGSVKADAGSSGIADVNPTASAGGGQGHDHTLASDGSHVHAFDAKPDWLAVTVYRRTA